MIHTNTQTAYAAGRFDDLRTGSDEYWEYSAVLDGRETELCEYLNGKIFSKDDPFWDTYFPPNHFNCRSSVISLSADEVAEKGLKTEPDGNALLKKVKLSIGAGFEHNPKNSLDVCLNNRLTQIGDEETKKTLAQAQATGLPLPKKIVEVDNTNIENNLYKHTQNTMNKDIIYNFKNIDRTVAYGLAHTILNESLRVNLKNVVYIGIDDINAIPKKYLREYETLGNKLGGVIPLKDGKMIILLNEGFHNNLNVLVTRLSSGQRIGTHSGDTPNVSHTLYHEIGHVIIRTYGLDKNEIFLDKITGKKYSVSDSGDRDVIELMCEAYADVRVSKSPHSSSLSIVRMMESEIGIKLGG